jgi:hypothetical protein
VSLAAANAAVLTPVEQSLQDQIEARGQHFGGLRSRLKAGCALRGSALGNAAQTSDGATTTRRTQPTTFQLSRRIVSAIIDTIRRPELLVATELSRERCRLNRRPES